MAACCAIRGRAELSVTSSVSRLRFSKRGEEVVDRLRTDARLAAYRILNRRIIGER
jgi:hypothetical protein